MSPTLLKAIAIAIVATLISACNDQGDPVNERNSIAPIWTDVTQQLGIPVSTPDAWPDGTYMLPEITGGGVALFDYDGDGDLDIYQVCFAPPGPWPQALDVSAPNRLFQQQDDGTFKKIPDAGGMNDPGFGQGVATGDFDNDGDVDVYVTNYGTDRLYANNGDGTFTDQTAASKLDDPTAAAWSSSATFVDYDRDGYLDLYVTKYLAFDPDRKCKGKRGVDYCGPGYFAGMIDRLYRNSGNGTFENVTASAGIDLAHRGLGVICADLTGDGLVDIYVANDMEPNDLWVNRGDGTFENESMGRGVAVNGSGGLESSMGVTIGDINGDGLFDLFMTHQTDEKNTLYRSMGPGQFADKSATVGLAAPSLPYTGWGCVFFDYDHDGDLDIAIANGRVSRGPDRSDTKLGTFWNQFAEPNQLFDNDGNGNFSDATKRAGPFAKTIEVSHALAAGDIDNDGDPDMVVVNLDNTIRVYRNDAPPGDYHWLVVRAVIKTPTGQRDAIGATMTLELLNRNLVRQVLPGQSYLASCDPRVHFGLGTNNVPKSLRVVWPDGKREQFAVEGVDRHIVIRQGEGDSTP